MSSRVETAVINFGNQQERRGRTNAAESRQSLRLVLGRKGTCRLSEGRLTVAFDFVEQFLDHLVATEKPPDFSPEERRHWPSIARAVLVEMVDPSPADPLAGDADAVQGAQPFDPSHKPRSLVDQGFAFAAEPLGVLFFNSGDANLSGHRAVTAQPGSQDARHSFGVEPVGLGPPTTSRLQKAGGIEHHGANAGLQQKTRQPEPIVADFVANRELERAPESQLGRGKRAQPFRLAEFEGNAADVVSLRHSEYSSCFAESLAATLPPLFTCIGSTSTRTWSSARKIRPTRPKRPAS